MVATLPTESERTLSLTGVYYWSGACRFPVYWKRLGPSAPGLPRGGESGVVTGVISTRTDPRFDAYLDAVPEFAQPILEHVRGLVHEVCPTVQETVKWKHATFVYRKKILVVFTRATLG